MKRPIILFTLLLAALGVSCIENDIPYPDATLSIERITGQGFTARIEPSTRSVVLTLDEQTDIRRVAIDEVTFGVSSYTSKLTDEQMLSEMRLSRPLTGEFDLRAPLYVTLSLYEDFEWTITAEQHIERSFEVGRQVGATEFDPELFTATAYVAKGTDLTRIDVASLKLGPARITTYSPTAEELSGTSFETVRFVDIAYYEETERWLLYVRETDRLVELTGAYAWSEVIWLYGTGVAGEAMGFRYRKAGDTQWLDVPDVATSGGSFSARLAAAPETTYEIKAFCGDEESDPATVTTDPVRQLPNSSFEEWCTEDEIVYPYAPGAAPYWSSGNKGAKIAGSTLTDKCDPRPGSEGRYAADLRSEFANIFGVGKFAAGNLFIGDYVRNEGTNGVLTFGRSFVLRPTRLRIWAKYHQGIIDRVKSVPAGSDIQVGDPDHGHIYIALGTWGAPENLEKYGKDSKGVLTGTADSPVCVDTRDVATFFRNDGPDVIAYGEKVFDSSVEEWTEFTIDLNYNRYDLVPTNIMVVCSASRWGDYFTGSSKSEMWVDDFVLEYD
ncbi:MAG: PCMD domain-containing protein [Alistipes sp.]|nr:PCMD domain-containing protein [Alistipes sp.]